MTNDSLDYLVNPDAPADWFVKFPLKECADLFGLRKLLASTTFYRFVNIWLKNTEFDFCFCQSPLTDLSALLEFDVRSLHRSDRPTGSSRNFVGRM
jgi:hypothetical protein